MQDSGHRPFVNLDRFVSDNKISLKSTIDISPPDPAENDFVVFTDAMKDVRIVTDTRPRIEHRYKSPANRKKKGDVSFAEALKSDNRLHVASLPEFMEGFAEGTNALTIEKLKKGEFSVQKTLDLHGFSTDDAAELFQEFVQNAIRQGLRCVKIIHGRGLKSRNAPVLRESLKSWIIKAMHRKWIIAFSNAIMAEGGPGATYILLKKHPKKKRIHVLG